MIDQSKLPSALAALQAVLIKARDMAYEKVNHEDIAEILDYAEILPAMIASDENKTDAYISTIEEISKRFNCGYIVHPISSLEAHF
jgi:hypothetical protein